MAACVVIGIGNWNRGDDVAGLAVLERLREDAMAVALIANGGDAVALMVAMAGAEAAILIDACVGGGAPGTLHRIDVASGALPSAGFGLSTHGFGLAAAIELARVLNQLPPVCVVHAVEGADFALGAGLSSPVAQAIESLAERVRHDIASWTYAERECYRPRRRISTRAGPGRRT
jgi:hydrogenase maturation protease